MARSSEQRSSQRFSDEELEFYGELFLTRKIRDAGVDFESFLSNPDYYLLKYPRRDGLRDGRDGRRRKGLLHFFRPRPARTSD